MGQVLHPCFLHTCFGLGQLALRDLYFLILYLISPSISQKEGFGYGLAECTLNEKGPCFVSEARWRIVVQEGRIGDLVSYLRNVFCLYLIGRLSSRVDGVTAGFEKKKEAGAYALYEYNQDSKNDLSELCLPDVIAVISY